MNKKIIILIALVLLTASIALYGNISIRLVEVDTYDLNGQWCIDNTTIYDNEGNYKETRYFCFNNKGYNKGDKIILVYQIDDCNNHNELLHIKK